LKHVEDSKPSELILALKPSAEGEATIHYICELLKDKQLAITRSQPAYPLEEIWNIAVM
jgi:recombinational DNA repair protein RecR